MPRTRMSVLAPQRRSRTRRTKTFRLAARSALRQEREERQHDEVLQRQQEISQARGDRRRDAKVYLPQPSGAGLPQPQTLLTGGDARELLARVAHVEHLGLEQAGEDGAR